MRYLPHSKADREEMLKTIGAETIDDLFIAVPKEVYKKAEFNLPNHSPEYLVQAKMEQMANKNLIASNAPFFLGAGAYRHHIPATVDHLIQRSEWLTAYTPYQPEISQGTLQALFEFQTQVANLMGMEVANASMYDGSTATAEAALMARRITRKKKIILSSGLHPQYRDVVKTYLDENKNSASKSDADLVILDSSPDERGNIISHIDDNTAAIIVQTPDFFGNIRDVRALAEAAHAKNALLIVVITEIVSLGLLEAPGALGADIVVAEGQSLGNPLNFGGPYLGLMATRQKYTRQIPGRLCGETIDASGKRGFVLTLSTREQHIRREKATSNICTNAGLCALAFSIHLSLLGQRGLVKLAKINHAKAVKLAKALEVVDGVKLLNDSFFNEFTIALSKPANFVVEALLKKNILAGVPVSRLDPRGDNIQNLLVLAATELTSEADISALASALEEVLA
jgi:glycine dehydrogenase subunit 1